MFCEAQTLFVIFITKIKSVVIELLGVLHVLTWAKKSLWAVLYLHVRRSLFFSRRYEKAIIVQKWYSGHIVVTRRFKLVHPLSKEIVWRDCCLTAIWDDSANNIFVMRCEKQLWNVRVLKDYQARAVFNASLVADFVSHIFWVICEIVCSSKLAAFVINFRQVHL